MTFLEVLLATGITLFIVLVLAIGITCYELNQEIKRLGRKVEWLRLRSDDLYSRTRSNAQELTRARATARKYQDIHTRINAANETANENLHG